jgi:hypothetical protein
MKYQYGDGWEQYPIEPGEVWGIPDNGSKVAVHDIFNPLPDFMHTADLLFVDPPWTQGNLTAFYTKAGRDDYQRFEAFTAVLFQRIAEVAPTTCYIEIGNQFVDEWYGRLAELFPAVQRWPVVYYRKHPTNIIRGGQSPTAHDFTGMDEAKIIGVVGQVEEYRVMGDMCMGQGLVGLSAWAAGRPFVGTELNERRLANLLQRLAKKGAEVRRYD